MNFYFIKEGKWEKIFIDKNVFNILNRNQYWEIGFRILLNSKKFN